MNQRELTAAFAYEFRAFGDPSVGQARIVIAVFRDGEGNEIKAKGPADEKELVIGLTYRLFGRWTEHEKYGPQFAFDSFVAEKPSGREAIEAYLCQLNGIGPKKARKLWELYENDAVERLRESPQEVGEQIGLSEENAEAAQDFLRERQSIERTSIELYGLLHGRGLPKFKKLIEDIIQDYGATAAIDIHKNPYLLMRYNGIGFMRADKMYLEFGPESPAEKSKHAARVKRQALCAWHAIATAREGDTWFEIHVIRDAIKEKIGGARVDDVTIERAIRLAIRSGMLVEKQNRGKRWFAERWKARAEGNVARFVAEAAEETKQDGVKWDGPNLIDSGLTLHQYQQAMAALKGVICVLAGSPGTGKTFSTAAIIRLVMKSGASVAACAPTGKAAVRLTEALNKNGISLRATTIHSLLGIARSGDDGFGFMHDELNPLQFQFVFVDESSMIDTGLMASLLAARARGTHFLFIGDPNQLAPVGHGAPLRDFITSKVPTGTLTEIKRQQQGSISRIVRACAEIRDKRKFSAGSKPDLPAGEDLILIPRDSPQSQIETLEILVRQFIGSDKYDPIWDVQIIVAVNKKSPLGRKPLNEKLQNLLNPNGRRVEKNQFRVGDKIVCVKNSWFPSVDPDAAERDGKSFVANGEQGEVLDVTPGRTIARLTAPDREIIIPRGNRDAEDDANVSEEDTGTGCNWESGFAISCHKSQGSEWKIVIVLADEYGGARMVQSRQWLYTAVSRAKELCIVVGKQSTCQDMCGRDALFRRKTFLVERIREEMGPTPGQAIRPSAWNDAVLDELLAGVC